MSHQNNIKKLIASYNRRLQKLKEQQAIKGLDTPPATLLEIEDIEEKLAGLEIHLGVLESSPQPDATPAPAVDIERELARLEAGQQPATQTQIGGVNIGGISGGTINLGNVSAGVQAGGDIVAGDKTEVVQAAPTGQESPQAVLAAALTQWQQEIEAKIAALSELDEDEKEELQEKAAKVEQEMAKGEPANLGKIERLLNTMSSMAPDILAVTAKTLQNPFAGVGLVLEKINDRIKLERDKSDS